MSAFTTHSTNNTFNFVKYPSITHDNYTSNFEVSANYDSCPNKKESSNFNKACCSTTDISSSSSNSANEDCGSMLKDGVCCCRSNRSNSFEHISEHTDKNYVNEMVQIINYSPEILSKVQAYNRLCREVQDTEKSIMRLLQAKNSKTSNIEDLRCLIRRIASEDSFSSRGFVGKSSRNFIFNLSSKQQRTHEQKTNGSSNKSRSVQPSYNNLGNDTTSATEGSAPCETDGEQDPRGDKANHNDFNTSYHFKMCFNYWQDVLPSHLPSIISQNKCKQS